jgi:translation initiation factor IF-2
VAELAKAIGAKAGEVIKKLMALGVAANINQSIDFETASVVADEFGFELELDTFEEESLISETEDLPEDLVPRPPVVTIMGHVDHGKTSLLDYIRESDIIGGESGGITQHIGAYYVKTEGGDIVFLDTPGHEAFTAMRARGAKVTDIIVLVVAADDGVMPQTKEAINHARAADIPMVVAVNKIDKPEADTEKIKRELAEMDLAPEEWGGETMYGHISAKTGQGVDELLSLILLEAEVLELKGNPNKKARGSIVEANLDKSKGPVATVLMKNGTLKPGDQFVCGDYYGRVRAMLDHRGRRMKSAGPSMPVEIYGISGVPMAGDEFVVVGDEKTAKQVIDYRVSRSKQQAWVSRGLVSLEDLFERIKEGDVKELNIVFKADVQGSLEAVTESLLKQGTDEVKLKIIHSATGAISESDVMLASASGAIIIGFNVRANPRVSEIAERENVDIRYYDVIYNVIKDIRLAMAGLLEPTYEEHTIGRAEVKEVFRIPKVGSVAGCYVTNGHVERNANARLLRDEVVVFDGKIASLRRFKDDVKEVKSGYECGIGLENFQDIKPGDVFEAYQVEEVEAQL